MADTVLLVGSVAARYEVQRLLNEAHPGLAVDSVEHPWQMADRAANKNFEVAVVLEGAISAHEERMAAIRALRGRGFAGRILVAGSFLTEREDALAAGADAVFDASRQRCEAVIEAGLRRPLVAVDHPYLAALFPGEWCVVERFSATLPARVPDLLLCAVSLHEDASFFMALGEAFARREGATFILVDDGGSEEATVAALASGVQPVVVLADEGVMKVRERALAALRARWLTWVQAA